ncbi:MAG: RimK family alpha-L-glutamate ligase [Pirellulaceae bacterium]|nr:RimK family alpha-L-glutamate ligase [Pirellulaceae bacterium]
MSKRQPHVVVLGNVGQWHWQDLSRAANGCCRLSRGKYEQLQCRLSNSAVRVMCGSLDLTKVDAVLCRAMPRGSLEQIVFRMDALATLERQDVPLLNPPKAIETCIDKFSALSKLRDVGLPVPLTIACQNTRDAIEAFEDLGGDVVLKPLFGSEGRGLLRLTSKQLASRVFSALERSEQTIYLQTFVRHGGKDLRLLVLGDKVLTVQRSREDDWRLNASRGADVEVIDPKSEIVALARQAVEVVGAVMGGVDVVIDPCGNPHILEINASPGWRHVSAACKIDVAQLVVKQVLTVSKET